MKIKYCMVCQRDDKLIVSAKKEKHTYDLVSELLNGGYRVVNIEKIRKYLFFIDQVNITLVNYKLSMEYYVSIEDYEKADYYNKLLNEQ